MPEYRVSPQKSGSAAINPTVTDDVASGYEVDSTFRNTVTGQRFICRSNAVGAAVWDLDSDAGAEVQAIKIAGVDRVTNSALELAHVTTLPILANTLKAGDRIRVSAKTLLVSRNAADTHDIALRLGDVATGTKIASTGAGAFDATEYVFIDGTITIASIGAGGTCHVDILIKKNPATVYSETRTVGIDVALPTDIDRSVTITTLASAANASNQNDLRDVEFKLERVGTY